MLIRFSVENYNSFKERQVFSMVAGKQTRHPDHCISVNGKRLLKSSFFFGANASGKSNFVRAIDFMRQVTLTGMRAVKYDDRYFRIDPEYKERPGVFQMDFMENGTVFSYGFAIDYASHEICGEWLYRVDSPEKEVCMFEREKGEKIQTGLTLSKADKMRFDIYCEDLNDNELLLREIGNKNLKQESAFADFLAAYDWFEKIVVVYPDSHPYVKNDYYMNAASDGKPLLSLLKNFDTGIVNVKPGKQSPEKAFSFLPDDYKKMVLDDIERNIKEKLKDGSHCSIKIGKHLFEISLEGDEVIVEKIMMDHGNPEELFELADESDGTRRLFDLIPLYEMGQKEHIIVIDELDRSFHSKLTEEYVKRFFAVTKDKPSQLICTTHDLNLLDLKMVRQDEIWFVEREKDHSSRIYSLSDYKQRFDKNVLNDYLLGRYGAIPCFQQCDWQEEEE